MMIDPFDPNNSHTFGTMDSSGRHTTPGAGETLPAAVGAFSDFAGAYGAPRYLDKIKISADRYTVAMLMLVMGFAMAACVVG